MAACPEGVLLAAADHLGVVQVAATHLATEPFRVDKGPQMEEAVKVAYLVAVVTAVKMAKSPNRPGKYLKEDLVEKEETTAGKRAMKSQARPEAQTVPAAMVPTLAVGV